MRVVVVVFSPPSATTCLWRTTFCRATTPCLGSGTSRKGAQNSLPPQKEKLEMKVKAVVTVEEEEEEEAVMVVMMLMMLVSLAIRCPCFAPVMASTERW